MLLAAAQFIQNESLIAAIPSFMKCCYLCSIATFGVFLLPLLYGVLERCFNDETPASDAFQGMGGEA